MSIIKRQLAVQSVNASKKVASKNDAIAVLAEAFGLGFGDKMKMTIANGFVSAHVKKNDGQVISHKSNIDSNFRQMTIVGSDATTPYNRRKIVRELRNEGKSQVAIANILGVCQATISLDLKSLGMK